MPFKSEAQRRKFYAMKARGEISQKTIDEWEHNTPKNIPKRVRPKKKKRRKRTHNSPAIDMKSDEIVNRHTQPPTAAKPNPPVKKDSDIAPHGNGKKGIAPLRGRSE